MFHNLLKKRKPLGQRKLFGALIVQIVGYHPDHFLRPGGARSRECYHPNVVGPSLEVPKVFGGSSKFVRKEVILGSNLHETRSFAYEFVWILLLTINIFTYKDKG